MPAGEEEIELRAVAIAACASVVRKSAAIAKFRDAPLSAPKLDYYLWKKAKEGDNRMLLAVQISSFNHLPFSFCC